MATPDDARRDLVGLLRLVHAAWLRDIERQKQRMRETERELASVLDIADCILTSSEPVAVETDLANLRDLLPRFPGPVSRLVALGVERFRDAERDVSAPRYTPAGPGWSTPLGKGEDEPDR
jgi:hypothetical protein